MAYTSHAIARLLRQLDSSSGLGTEEPISTRLLQLCLDELPTLSRRLTGLSEIEAWRRGGRGEGDLVGVNDGERLVHLEIKSRTAQINSTKGPCMRPDCPGPQSQLAHMLEDDVPVVVVAPPASRSERQLEGESETTLVALKHATWSDVAGMIEAEPEMALRDPLAVMLGVAAP